MTFSVFQIRFFAKKSHFYYFLILFYYHFLKDFYCNYQCGYYKYFPFYKSTALHSCNLCLIDESIGRIFNIYSLFLPLCMFLIGLFGGSFAVDRESRGFLYSCTFYGFLLKILVLLISILSVALTLMYHLSAGYRKEKIFGQTFMTYSYTVRKCEQSLRVLSA